LMLLRWNRTGFFLACFAFITYLPTSNLLFPIGSIMAERFLYLPAVGVIGCVILAGHAVARRYNALRLAAIAAGIVTACLMVRTWERNRDWRDGLSMANAMIETSPNSYKSHKSRAMALYRSDGTYSRLDDAIAEFEKSMAILDSLPDEENDAVTYMLAGELYLQKGDRLKLNNADGEPSEAAVAYYRRALDALKRCDGIVRVTNRLERERVQGNSALTGLPTRFAPLYRLLSAVYLRLNDNERSLKEALYARELAPDDAQTYRQLASSYFDIPDPEQGVITLIEGIILTSDASLRDAVIDIYNSGLDVEGCAVVRRGNDVSLNPSCGIVHRHICAASADAIQLLIRTGRPEQAGSVRKLALDQVGCDAASLNSSKVGSNNGQAGRDPTIGAHSRHQ
jgi:hypothetical protein